MTDFRYQNVSIAVWQQLLSPSDDGAFVDSDFKIPPPPPEVSELKGTKEQQEESE